VSAVGFTGSAQGGGKPTATVPKFEKFPAELISLCNWVNWRYLPPKTNGGKWRKVPFQPNGKTADTTDRSTWSGFQDCCAAYARGGFDGLGFVFDGEVGEDGLCYCGVDFDSCIENGKDLHSLAKTRIKRLDTYTERSVSDTGIHCIARAEPLDRIVKFDGVEIYTKARYFTFTGVAFGTIKSAPNAIRALVNEVRAKEAAAKQQQTDHLGSIWMVSTEVPNSFENAKVLRPWPLLIQITFLI
jgi:primase-polymerase (primpol)-like protein